MAKITELDLMKIIKKIEIKEAFKIASLKPIVDTGLGFSVDGGYNNKLDFEVGKKYSLPQIRASDNIMHNVLLADYDTILTAIEIYGITLYQKKWQLESNIENSLTLQDLSLIVW